MKKTIKWVGGTVSYEVPEKLKRKLPPKVKASWLTNLRSGEFLQGKSHLCSVGNSTGQLKYCCLGVLVKDKLKPLRDSPHLYYNSRYTGFVESQPEFKWLGQLGNLPVAVQRASSRGPGGLRATLAGLNDDDVPFDVIAQVIEDLL